MISSVGELRNFVMRRFLIVAMLSIVAQAAEAADWPEDMPVLRGGFSENVGRKNWEGWYLGGQFGYSAAELDMGNSSKSLTDYMLRDSNLQETVGGWSLLDSKNAAGTGFGGFVGRNWQWDDIVLGLEANYSNLQKISATSAGINALLLSPPSSTVLPPGYTYTYGTTLSGWATTTIKDMVTLRARAGWDAGNFMPYAFGGLAIGRINVTRSATLDVRRNEYVTNPLTGATTFVRQVDVSPVPPTMSEGGADTYAAGYAVGVGTEVNLIGGLFARAEWEYVRFMKVKDVATSMNSARVGIGYKF
jgi:outer membrane immunogenic protein